MKLPSITHVAILDNEGNPVALPAPNRHHHIIRKMAREGHPTPITGEQGFLLSDGTFVGRMRARMFAIAAGQVIQPMHRFYLFSEDLW